MSYLLFALATVEHRDGDMNRIANISPDGTLRLLVRALSAETPPSVLRDLGYRNEEHIREAVAGNPNTPTETLLRLARYYPDAVLQNPVMDLLFLEDPSFTDRLSWQAFLNVLGWCDYSSDWCDYSSTWFNRASVHPDAEVRRKVAEYASAPDAALKRLAEDEDWRVRLSVAELPAYTEFVFDSLVPLVLREWRLWGHDSELCRTVLWHEKMPASVILRFAKIGDTELERMVAKCPVATEEALTHLARHADEKVRLYVARRFDTPPGVLRQLTHDGKESVRLRARITLRLRPAAGS